jgi:hypothetical protein
MSAHTPGPWRVVDGAILSDQINTYGNWIVAGIERDRTDEDEANLRLIAAAPALYELMSRIYVQEGAALRPETCTEALALLAQVQGERNGNV